MIVRPIVRPLVRPVVNSITDRLSGSSSWTALSPTNLVATVLSSTSIKLDWTNNDTTGDGVSIERSTDGVTYAEIDTVALGVATYTDTTCVAGTLYYYRVRAFKN